MFISRFVTQKSSYLEDQTLRRHSHTQLLAIFLSLSLKMKLLLCQSLQPHIHKQHQLCSFFYDGTKSCALRCVLLVHIHPNTHTLESAKEKYLYDLCSYIKEHKKSINKQKKMCNKTTGKDSKYSASVDICSLTSSLGNVIDKS